MGTEYGYGDYGVRKKTQTRVRKRIGYGIILKTWYGMRNIYGLILKAEYGIRNDME